MSLGYGAAGLLTVGALAALMEVLGTGLGMMYGTLMSPLLILLGYAPKAVVPAILLSQVTGGIAGSFGHHAKKNSDFGGLTRDMKIALAIIVPGLAACVFGASLGHVLPKVYMTAYIGALVTLMGFLCLKPVYYEFSWKKLWAIGLLAGFNKALSGGGFGPVTSTGKILGGVDPRVSVGTSTLAAVPVCIVSYGTWMLLGGRVNRLFLYSLCAGSLAGGLVGPSLTARLDTGKLRVAVGWLAMGSGIWLLTDLALGLGLGQ